MAVKTVTLYEDSNKTTTLYPRTKVSAVSNEDGVGLDSLLVDAICVGEDLTNTQTVPLNADTLGGRLPQYYITPYNLLDNSDFRNPVNQRGKTSYTFENGNGYCIDRWYSWSSDKSQTVSVENGFVRLTSGTLSTFAQRFPRGFLDSSKTYTFAYKTQTGIKISHSFWSNAQCDYIQITVEENETIDVEWVALYEGSYTADTLPPYHPKGYAHELMECQRYYQLLKLCAYRTAGSGTRGQLFFQLPIPMRSSPNFSLLSGGLVLAEEATPTISSIVGTYCYSPYDSGSFIVDLDSTTDATSPGWKHRYIWVDGSIALSADL